MNCFCDRVHNFGSFWISFDQKIEEKREREAQKAENKGKRNKIK